MEFPFDVKAVFPIGVDVRVACRRQMHHIDVIDVIAKRRGSSSGAARPGACVVAVPWIGGLRPADPVQRQKFAQRRLDRLKRAGIVPILQENPQELTFRTPF